MSALFTPPSSFLCDTWTHSSYKFSLLDRLRGGDIAMCFVKWETYCISFEEFDAQFDIRSAYVY